MVSPMASELVAAGEGALQTCIPDLFSTITPQILSFSVIVSTNNVRSVILTPASVAIFIAKIFQ